MRSIHIKASCEYDVLVERGLLDRAGELLREVSASESQGIHRLPLLTFFITDTASFYC